MEAIQSLYKMQPKYIKFISILPILFSTMTGEVKAEIEPGMAASLNVENKDTLHVVQSLLTTYQVIASNDARSPEEELAPRIVNFIFSSGRGFLADQRISRSALPMLPKNAIDRISNLNTRTNQCYVQDFIQGDGSRVTVGIYNEGENDRRNVYRCLISTLWQFQNDELKSIDDWKTNFIELIKKKRS